MNNTSRVLCLISTFLVLGLTPEKADAECAPFPEVAWWGELTHEGIKGYVQQKHGGDWAGYMDKWARQASKVKQIHSQGKGIKIPSTGQTIKGQQLSDYVAKLNQRVEINRCLSQEKGSVETTTKKKKKIKKKVATPYGQGVAAYRAGEFKKAHNIWLVVAKGGNPKALNALGHLYRKGLGVEKNLDTARQWYGKSAAGGNAVAQYSLGDIGREIATNKKEKIAALKLIMKAALQNYAPAQLVLAEVNQTGEGVRVNMKEAYFWSLLAVKNNYKKAVTLNETVGETLSDPVKSAQSDRADKWLLKHK